LDQWNYFFQAQVGASAALVGLIFVSISISLTRILAAPHLPGRALQALIDLFQIFVAASLMLVPQAARTAGIEILTISLAIWGVILVLNLRTMRRATERHRRRLTIRIAMSQVNAMLYLGAGIAMLAYGADGIFVLVPAVIFSYLVAIIDAWVLLIEINR
jgi:modulator of FtsH protease